MVKFLDRHSVCVADLEIAAKLSRANVFSAACTRLHLPLLATSRGGGDVIQSTGQQWQVAG